MPVFFDENRFKTVIYSLPTILVFASTAVLSPHTNFICVNVPFHSAIESAGSIVALILSVLLLSTNNDCSNDAFKYFVSSALIGMGILDLFHSFVSPGDTFVLLHSSATLLGGILFSGVWLSSRIIHGLAALPVVVLIVSCLFSLTAMRFPGFFPEMLDGDDFTRTAELVNLAGGFGFLGGSFWFYKRFARHSEQNFILFANHCLLFGASAILFNFSKIWDFEWWVWHAMRLFAYVVAIFLIYRIYKNVARQKEILITELQDAMKNIRVLRGFLPICASCKKIRDDKGYWSQIESYISKHSEARFSHGVCPECTRKLYPDLADKLNGI